MLKRKIKNSIQVTFSLPVQAGDESVFLVGDFNNWDGQATPMSRTKEGTWEAKLNLPPGREYQFRYLANGVEWRNDSSADRQVPNPYGSENSVVSTFVIGRGKQIVSRTTKS